MKPYYDDGSCVIYHGDCREILPEIEADVLVTDPPYGMSFVVVSARHRKAGRAGGSKAGRARFPLRRIVGREGRRVELACGHVIHTTGAQRAQRCWRCGTNDESRRPRVS